MSLAKGGFELMDGVSVNILSQQGGLLALSDTTYVLTVAIINKKYHKYCYFSITGIDT